MRNSPSVNFTVRPQYATDFVVRKFTLDDCRWRSGRHAGLLPITLDRCSGLPAACSSSASADTGTTSFLPEQRGWHEW